MIKHPIGIKDLNNSYVRSMFNDVVTTFRELSLATWFRSARKDGRRCTV